MGTWITGECFRSSFEFSHTFTRQSFYNSIEAQWTFFLFLLQNTPTKKENNLFTLIIKIIFACVIIFTLTAFASFVFLSSERAYYHRAVFFTIYRLIVNNMWIVQNNKISEIWICLSRKCYFFSSNDKFGFGFSTVIRNHSLIKLLSFCSCVQQSMVEK